MIKFRLYSKYDSTDSLKNMKDSAILNKSEKGELNTSKLGAIGAGAGAIIGAAGATGGKLSKLAGGTKGALAGAAIGAGLGLAKSAHKKAKDNDFYNSRLREAKKAAARREKLDWAENMHGRTKYE